MRRNWGLSESELIRGCTNFFGSVNPDMVAKAYTSTKSVKDRDLEKIRTVLKNKRKGFNMYNNVVKFLKVSIHVERCYLVL